MSLKFVFISILIIGSFTSFSSNELPPLRHGIGMQFGGQSLVSFQYEYGIVAKKKFSLLTDFGLGKAKWGDSDPLYFSPAIHVIYFGITPQFGFQKLKFLATNMTNKSHYFAFTGKCWLFIIEPNINE